MTKNDQIVVFLQKKIDFRACGDFSFVTLELSKKNFFSKKLINILSISELCKKPLFEN